MISEAISTPPRVWLTSFAVRAVALLEFLVAAAAFELLLQNAWTIATAPKVNADSGTALSISVSLANGDSAPLISTLSPPLQTGTYAVLLATGWTGAVSAVPALLSLGLALLMAGIVFKATKSTIGAAAPLILLLFSGIFWEQTGFLTFYPAFALLGYGGLYFAFRYIHEDESGGVLAVSAGFLIALSLYAFTTALLFLPVPALVLVCYWSTRRFWRALQVYVCAGIFVLPWFAWHIAVGGEHFYYHPLSWFTEDMLPIVNREFWQYPRESLLDYSQTMASVGIDGLLIAPMWGLVPLGIVYTWRTFGVRAVAFVLLSAGLFVLSLAVMRPSPFLRYFYPAFPGVIILASFGAVMLWQSISSLLSVRLLAGSAALVAIVAAFASHAAPEPLSSYKHKYAEHFVQSASYSDLSRIAKLIDDDRGIIARDSAVQILLPHNQTNTVIVMSESDYVTYLSWPDEAAVLGVMSEKDIGWVLLYKNAERWERDYNVWLERSYGVSPRHYTEIESAPNFRKIYDGTVYVLYRVVGAAAAP